MVNVLIGIIGVILFIGLALAGAAFLGPKFTDAMVNSKAMAVSQLTNQVTMALTMHRGDEQVPVVAKTSLVTLVPKGYLKDVPVNPFIGEGGYPFRVLYSGAVESPDYYADVVFVSLGGGNENMMVCEAINRQGPAKSDDIPQMPVESGTDIRSMLNSTTGCFQVHALGIYGEANPGDYVVYSRI